MNEIIRAGASAGILLLIGLFATAVSLGNYFISPAYLVLAFSIWRAMPAKTT